MKPLLFAFYLSFSFTSIGQVVFLETFDEADDATTGVDNTAGTVPWTATCPGSLATSDYLKVLSGKLEARDTNGPAAAWETGDIDISSCVGLVISLDIEELDDMEACADCGGTGTNCIDWVKLEYNLDGAGWTEIAGSTCGLAASPGEMIVIGDILGGGPITYTSPCIDFGTTLALRLSCMCWAGSEVWQFDNITVTCNDCVLPIDFINFQVEKAASGTKISWSTLEEKSNDYFQIERSYDGVAYEIIGRENGAGNSNEKLDYTFMDASVTPNGMVYYRIRQFDFDGVQYLSRPISIELYPEVQVFYGNGALHFNLDKNGDQTYLIQIYTANGEIVAKSLVKDQSSIPWSQPGFFVVDIPELNFHQKIVIN